VPGCMVEGCTVGETDGNALRLNDGEAEGAFDGETEGESVEG